MVEKRRLIGDSKGEVTRLAGGFEGDTGDRRSNRLPYAILVLLHQFYHDLADCSILLID
jgi:hypothetical protein